MLSINCSLIIHLLSQKSELFLFYVELLLQLTLCHIHRGFPSESFCRSHYETASTIPLETCCLTVGGAVSSLSFAILVSVDAAGRVASTTSTSRGANIQGVIKRFNVVLRSCQYWTVVPLAS